MAYTGPGDIVGSAVLWAGLRAYSTAKAATAPFNCMDVVDSAGGALAASPIKILPTGGIDYAGVQTAITQAGSNVPIRCSKLYDQISTNDLIQATLANMPAVVVNPSGLGANQVALQFSGNQFLRSTSNLGAVAQPWTFTAFAIQPTTTGTVNDIVYAQSTGSNDNFIAFNSTADNVVFRAVSASGATATTGLWHCIVGVANNPGTSWWIGVDGTATALTLGTEGIIGTQKLSVGGDIFSGNPFTGSLTEVGYWASAFGTTSGSSATITSLGGGPSPGNGNEAFWFAANPNTPSGLLNASSASLSAMTRNVTMLAY